MKTPDVSVLVNNTIVESLCKKDISVDAGIDPGVIQEIVDMCRQKILGNGHRDYAEGDKHRFETMSIPELIDYKIDEMVDEINYTVFAIYRLREFREELQLRGVVWTEKHESSMSGSLVSREMTEKTEITPEMWKITNAAYEYSDSHGTIPESSDPPTS